MTVFIDLQPGDAVWQYLNFDGQWLNASAFTVIVFLEKSPDHWATRVRLVDLV